MCRTEANDKLSRSKPQSSLISRNVFASLAFHLISAFIMQIVIMFDVQHQRFYRYLATAPNTKDNIATYECTALFSLNIFQTFGVAFVYSISRPFKKPLLTNRKCCILALTHYRTICRSVGIVTSIVIVHCTCA
jgi:magnesium-transporting ATPase (P-type)